MGYSGHGLKDNRTEHQGNVHPLCIFQTLHIDFVAATAIGGGGGGGDSDGADGEINYRNKLK